MAPTNLQLHPGYKPVHAIAHTGNTFGTGEVVEAERHTAGTGTLTT